MIKILKRLLFSSCFLNFVLFFSVVIAFKIFLRRKISARLFYNRRRHELKRKLLSWNSGSRFSSSFVPSSAVFCLMRVLLLFTFKTPKLQSKENEIFVLDKNYSSLNCGHVQLFAFVSRRPKSRVASQHFVCG